MIQAHHSDRPIAALQESSTSSGQTLAQPVPPSRHPSGHHALSRGAPTVSSCSLNSMNIQSLGELREPDERVLRFTPLGLATGQNVMTAEAAATFQQEAIARADLVPVVPNDTRQSFERLRSLHNHGIFCYDLFTAAD